MSRYRPSAFIAVSMLSQIRAIEEVRVDGTLDAVPIPAIVAFIEFIIYLTMSDEAFAAKYGHS